LQISSSAGSQTLTSGSWEIRPQPNFPLRIPGYNTGLRPHEVEGGGLRQGEHFSDKKREINFSRFCADVFQGWPLIHFFGSCVANIPVYKGVGRKNSRKEAVEKSRSRNCTNNSPSIY